jgi:hypothetical protein
LRHVSRKRAGTLGFEQPHNTEATAFCASMTFVLSRLGSV